jgi:Calcineurin-like phosphoesterase
MGAKKMGTIRYVCMSDLHFGQDTGVFTNIEKENNSYVIKPLKTNETMEDLATVMRAVINKNNTNGKKPTLILAGDILEMALNTTNYGAMVFERFLESFMPKGDKIFDDIIFIPGNHDHHLWERSRETQYFQFLSTLKKNEFLPYPWHTTKMIVKPEDESRFAQRLIKINPDVKGKNHMTESTFLTMMARRNKHLQNFTIYAAYPNFGVVNEDKSKVIMFSHGHYIESLYQLITTVMNILFPKRGKIDRIYQIETENFAWIDFFWSALGRSGGAGKDIELIYNKMLSGKSFKKLITNAILTYLKINKAGFFDKMKAHSIKLIVELILDKIMKSEKLSSDGYLTKDAEVGLKNYLQTPTSIQLYSELKKIPEDLTFVFGHTHKPFQKYDDYVLTNSANETFNRQIALYNTGGWVVETIEAATEAHGAAAVLIDNEFNEANLRLYNEGDYKVRVGQAGADTNPLSENISAILGQTDISPLCKKFSGTVKKAIAVRKKVLKANIDNQKGH